jgi:hypothetical protein
MIENESSQAVPEGTPQETPPSATPPVVPPRKKMGRPRIEINYGDLDKLCFMQATLREIAQWFECSEDTVERAIKRDKKVTFAEYFEQKRSRGRVSLRRKQWDVANTGNVTMLIWLGKQWLGQRDVLDLKQTGKIEVTRELSDKEIDAEIERILGKAGITLQDKALEADGG